MDKRRNLIRPVLISLFGAGVLVGGVALGTQNNKSRCEHARTLSSQLVNSSTNRQNFCTYQAVREARRVDIVVPKADCDRRVALERSRLKDIMDFTCSTK